MIITAQMLRENFKAVNCSTVERFENDYPDGLEITALWGIDEEDGTAIPLADVQHSLDDATRYLAEMDRQHRLGQWLAYLFESIEESMGIVALRDAHAILHTRFNNSRW